MNKLPSHKKRRRAQLCALGPVFEERVKAVRSELGIPEQGFPKRGIGFPEEAMRWYEEHIKRTTGRQHKDLPHYYWHFPKELAELIEDFGFSGHPCRAGFHPEVLLDYCAMHLVHEFGLPEEVVNEVKKRILVEESGGLGLSSPIQLILIPIDEQDEGVKFLALIAGIDGATTQKDWSDAWRQIRVRMQMCGIETASTKREGEKILLRDLAWWKWHMEGLSAREIADKWEQKHEGEAYGEDTIRAAIERIHKIMRPIS